MRGAPRCPRAALSGRARASALLGLRREQGVGSTPTSSRMSRARSIAPLGELGSARGGSATRGRRADGRAVRPQRSPLHHRVLRGAFGAVNRNPLGCDSSSERRRRASAAHVTCAPAIPSSRRTLGTTRPPQRSGPRWPAMELRHESVPEWSPMTHRERGLGRGCPRNPMSRCCLRGRLGTARRPSGRSAIGSAVLRL